MNKNVKLTPTDAKVINDAKDGRGERMTVKMVPQDAWRFAACDNLDCPTFKAVREGQCMGWARRSRKWTNGHGTLCDACAEEAGWIYEPMDENGKPSNRYEVKS